jgi:hypothetical protein
MQGLLSPTYIRVLPRIDGWGYPLTFNTDQALGSPTGADQYCIRSPGRDGRLDPSGTYTPGKTDDPDADIVYSNGTFIVQPAAPN